MSPVSEGEFKESYPLEKNVFVANLGEFLAKIDRARQ
jgi:hypothetical protein